MLNKIMFGSGDSQKRGDPQHVFRESLFRVRLKELMQLDKIRILSGCLAILLPSSFQFAWQPVKDGLVNETIRPVTNPTWLVFRCLKCVSVKAKQGDIEIVLECLFPSHGHSKQNAIDWSQALAGIAKRDDEPKAKLLGLLSASGQREKKRDLVKIQPVILERGAASLWSGTTFGFKPDVAKLLQRVLVRLNLFTQVSVLDAEHLGYIAGVRKQVIALVADGNQFFHHKRLPFAGEHGEGHVFLANVGHHSPSLTAGVAGAQAADMTDAAHRAGEG
jgi:hypothetical protein